MTGAVRGTTAFLVGVGIVLAVAALAQIPVGDPPEEAAVRIALRTAAGTLEVCRDRTEEELAALPPHMRKPRECRSLSLRYRLRLSVDGRLLVDEHLSPRGFRHNRPLVFDRLVRVSPGRHRLVADLRPDPAVELDEAEARAVEERATRFRLEEAVSLDPGEIALVLAEGDELRVRDR